MDDAMQPLFEAVADYFALLAEPRRLRILHCLCQGERSVGEIVDITQCSQANTSRHLNLMHASGLLTRRRVGMQVCYAIADTMLVDLCKTVCARLGEQSAHAQNVRRGARRVLTDLRAARV